VIDRRVIVVLLWILATSLVAFAVVVAFAALHHALGDLLVARILRTLASGLGILTVIDVVLLVAAIAIWICTMIDPPVLSEDDGSLDDGRGSNANHEADPLLKEPLPTANTLESEPVEPVEPAEQNEDAAR
jgi:hypothetical protein